jgi:hypothetical protein
MYVMKLESKEIAIIKNGEPYLFAPTLAHILSPENGKIKM